MELPTLEMSLALSGKQRRIPSTIARLSWIELGGRWPDHLETDAPKNSGYLAITKFDSALEVVIDAEILICIPSKTRGSYSDMGNRELRELPLALHPIYLESLHPKEDQ